MAIPLSTFITVNLSTGSPALQRTDFTIPLLMGYTTALAARTKRYNSMTILADMVTDGFSVYSPLYRMATAMTSRSDFKPSEIVIGRRATPPVQAINLTIASTLLTISITMSYMGTTVTYTRVGTANPAADATALAASIQGGVWGAAGKITAAGVGPVVQIRQGAGPDLGQIFYFDDPLYCSIDDATPDPGIAADLTAIRASDDNWYAVILDSNGGAEQEALADLIESLEKVHFGACQDYDIASGGGGNLAKTLKATSNTRYTGHWSRYSMAEYPGARVAAYALPRPAGSYNIAWKDISGWSTDSEMTGAEYSNISGDYFNCYLSGGRGVAPGGITPAGSWIDLVIMADWLRDAIRVALANILRANDKIPYTDVAGELALSEILKVYTEGADNGGLVLEDFSGTYLPAVSQTSGDRAARHFNGVRFTGTFAGAVNSFTVTGVVS
jgi:hypothetical protein